MDSMDPKEPSSYFFPEHLSFKMIFRMKFIFFKCSFSPQLTRFTYSVMYTLNQ